MELPWTKLEAQSFVFQIDSPCNTRKIACWFGLNQSKWDQYRSAYWDFRWLQGTFQKEEKGSKAVFRASSPEREQPISKEEWNSWCDCTKFEASSTICLSRISSLFSSSCCRSFARRSTILWSILAKSCWVACITLPQCRYGENEFAKVLWWSRRLWSSSIAQIGFRQHYFCNIFFLDQCCWCWFGHSFFFWPAKIPIHRTPHCLHCFGQSHKGQTLSTFCGYQDALPSSF